MLLQSSEMRLYYFKHFKLSLSRSNFMVPKLVPAIVVTKYKRTIFLFNQVGVFKVYFLSSFMFIYFTL